MKTFDRVESIIYFLLSAGLIGFSAYALMGALTHHLWESIALLFFLFLLGLTFASYGFVRWMKLRETYRYLSYYRTYLLIQFITFAYLTFLGSIAHFVFDEPLGVSCALIGLSITILSVIPIYFSFK